MSNWPVVIMSCDAFSDTWLPHLRLWDKYGGASGPIYLITENASFAARPDVTVIHPVDGEYQGSRDWMGMLRSCLRQIDAEYFLFTLDDFFLKAPIDWARIERYAAVALEAGCDTLTLGAHDTTRRGMDIGIPELLEADPTSPYWITTSPALWRRLSLLAILGERSGTAWEFEFTKPSDLSFAIKQYMVDRRFIFFAPVWPYYAEFWAGVDATPMLSDSAIAKGKWQRGLPLFLAHNDIEGIAYWRRGFHAHSNPIVGSWSRKLVTRLRILSALVTDVLIRPKLRTKALATLTERVRRALRGGTTV